MPGPKPPAIVLSGDERAALERLARAHTTGQQLAVRARIVLLAAEGLATSEVARRRQVGPQAGVLGVRQVGGVGASFHTERLHHQGPRQFSHGF